MGDMTSLPVGELVKLAAVDNDIYARTFFPRTFRQASPPFQKEVWNDLDNPAVRHSNQRLFRGGAKTTISRVFASKRIAYGVSRTILYVGASESAASRSGSWLRNNVERNKLWTQTYGLSPGKKWTDLEFEIRHDVLDQTIWCLFVGITGNIRGINFDDYRPDLIVLDDILTDENSSTLEQRTKIADLVHGALKKSLAPRVDEPNAKMCMLVTPQHRDDVSSELKKDPTWKTIEVPCWTKETLDLPVDQQVSIWPERLPTEELREEKRAQIKLNKLSIFSREMEMRLTTKENASFRPEWLKFYSEVPRGMTTCLAIDPTPPPSEKAIARGLTHLDFETLQVWGRKGQDYFLLERDAARGETPDWTIKRFFELAFKWKISFATVETVAYQATLRWLLEKEMQKRRVYYQVLPFVGKNKFARITSVLAGPMSHGHVYVRETDTPFISQVETYPNVDHDDELDAASIAVGSLINPYAAGNEDGSESTEFTPLRLVRGAP